MDENGAKGSQEGHSFPGQHENAGQLASFQAVQVAANPTGSSSPNLAMNGADGPQGLGPHHARVVAVTMVGALRPAVAAPASAAQGALKDAGALALPAPLAPRALVHCCCP